MDAPAPSRRRGTTRSFDRLRLRAARIENTVWKWERQVAVPRPTCRSCSGTMDRVDVDACAEAMFDLFG